MVKIYSPKKFIALLLSVLFTAVIFTGCKKNTEAEVVTSEQYIKYTINNVPYNYTAPADTFYHGINYSFTALAIFGENLVTPQNNATLLMAYPGMGVGSNQKLMEFWPYQITDYPAITIPIFVHITEFGAVGQFMAGEFTGVFTGSPPANTQYNVTCSFRVKR